MLEKSLDVISQSIWVGITPKLSAACQTTKGQNLHWLKRRNEPCFELWEFTQILKRHTGSLIMVEKV